MSPLKSLFHDSFMCVIFMCGTWRIIYISTNKCICIFICMYISEVPLSGLGHVIFMCGTWHIIYISTYIYIWMYVYIHLYVYISIYIYVHVYMYIYAQCISIYIYIWSFLFIHSIEEGQKSCICIYLNWSFLCICGVQEGQNSHIWGANFTWRWSRKRAINYKALLRKMTYENKAPYDSTPPCSERTVEKVYIDAALKKCCEPCRYSRNS